MTSECTRHTAILRNSGFLWVPGVFFVEGIHSHWEACSSDAAARAPRPQGLLLEELLRSGLEILKVAEVDHRRLPWKAERALTAFQRSSETPKVPRTVP